MKNSYRLVPVSTWPHANANLTTAALPTCSATTWYTIVCFALQVSVRNLVLLPRQQSCLCFRVTTTCFVQSLWTVPEWLLQTCFSHWTSRTAAMDTYAEMRIDKPSFSSPVCPASSEDSRTNMSITQSLLVPVRFLKRCPSIAVQVQPTPA